MFLENYYPFLLAGIKANMLKEENIYRIWDEANDIKLDLVLLKYWIDWKCLYILRQIKRVIRSDL